MLTNLKTNIISKKNFNKEQTTEIVRSVLTDILDNLDISFNADDVSDEEESVENRKFANTYKSTKKLDSKAVYRLSLDFLRLQTIENNYRNKKIKILGVSKLEPCLSLENIKLITSTCLQQTLEEIFTIKLGNEKIEFPLSQKLIADFKNIYSAQLVNQYVSKKRHIFRQYKANFPIKQTIAFLDKINTYVAGFKSNKIISDHKFTSRIAFASFSLANEPILYNYYFEQSRQKIINAINNFLNDDVSYKKKCRIVSDSGRILDNQNSNTRSTINQLCSETKDLLEQCTYNIIINHFIGKILFNNEEINQIREKYYQFIPEAIASSYKNRYCKVWIDWFIKKESKRGANSIIEKITNGESTAYVFKSSVKREIIKHSELKDLIALKPDIFDIFLPYNAQQFQKEICKNNHNTFEIFKSNLNREIKQWNLFIERKVLPQQFTFKSNNSLDFFSNIRLSNTGESRRISELKKDSENIIGSEIVQRRWLFFKCKYGALENQEITINFNRSDKLLHFTTYEQISSYLNKLKDQTKMQDKGIAICIRNILKGKQKIHESTELSSSQQKILVTFTQLLFGTEAARHPSCLIIHQMVLDLVEEGALTWAKLLAKEKMLPVAISKKEGSGGMGAVAGVRYIHKNYGSSMPRHHYLYSPGNASEEMGLKIIKKENDIIDLWQKTFPAKNIYDCLREEWYPEIFEENKADEIKIEKTCENLI